MEAHYHDVNDRQFWSHLARGAGPESKAYLGLNQAVAREDGAIPLKYRELVSVAVALTTQCAYCIETHTKAAEAAGATQEELAEVVFVAAAMRAGGAVAHGRMAMKFFENASREREARGGSRLEG